MTDAFFGPLAPLAPPTPAYPDDEATFIQPARDPVSGARVGYQELVRGETPPAGADFRFRVGGAETVYPLSVMVTLTTSAVVGERAVAVEYRDKDDVRFLVAGAPVTVDEGSVQTFAWYPHAGTVAWPVTDAALAPLPQMMLYARQSLVVRIVDADVDDQLSLVQLALERFPT